MDARRENIVLDSNVQLTPNCNYNNEIDILE